MNWYECDHAWKPVESQCERDVVCTKCGCPGERESDDDNAAVVWPAT